MVNNSNVFSIYVLTSPATMYSGGQATLFISTNAGLRDRALSDIRLLFNIDNSTAPTHLLLFNNINISTTQSQSATLVTLKCSATLIYGGLFIQ